MITMVLFYILYTMGRKGYHPSAHLLCNRGRRHEKMPKLQPRPQKPIKKKKDTTITYRVDGDPPKIVKRTALIIREEIDHSDEYDTSRYITCNARNVERQHIYKYFHLTYNDVFTSGIGGYYFRSFVRFGGPIEQDMAIRIYYRSIKSANDKWKSMPIRLLLLCTRFHSLNSQIDWSEFIGFKIIPDNFNVYAFDNRNRKKPIWMINANVTLAAKNTCKSMIKYILD